MIDNSTAKKYNNIKLFLSVAEGVLSFIFLFLFVELGYSLRLENYLRNFISSQYLVLLLFTISVGLVLTIIFAPINYYTEFYLEHKYNLSNQTFWKWIWEGAKETLIGGAIGLPLLLLFYYVLVTFGILWWLPFSILMFIFSVLLAQIVPILILPLFYKVVPIENEELKERIIKLSKLAGLNVENVFKFNMSKNTKKANAAFTGLGKTKRILLGDTLLENYSVDEIETVIAHELGHYKLKHIQKNILIGTISSFLIFYLVANLHNISLSWFNLNSIYEIASLPLLVLWGSIIGLIFQPITNWLSRKFEYEADAFAIYSTQKKDDFIRTLEKLTNQNLGDKEPHPFVEWFFYSHPSIKKRIAHIKSL